MTKAKIRIKMMPQKKAYNRNQKMKYKVVKIVLKEYRKNLIKFQQSKIKINFKGINQTLINKEMHRSKDLMTLRNNKLIPMKKKSINMIQLKK